MTVLTTCHLSCASAGAPRDGGHEGASRISGVGTRGAAPKTCEESALAWVPGLWKFAGNFGGRTRPWRMSCLRPTRVAEPNNLLFLLLVCQRPRGGWRASQRR